MSSNMDTCDIYLMHSQYGLSGDDVPPFFGGRYSDEQFLIWQDEAIGLEAYRRREIGSQEARIQSHTEGPFFTRFRKRGNADVGMPHASLQSKPSELKISPNAFGNIRHRPIGSPETMLIPIVSSERNLLQPTPPFVDPLFWIQNRYSEVAARGEPNSLTGINCGVDYVKQSPLSSSDETGIADQWRTTMGTSATPFSSGSNPLQPLLAFPDPLLWFRDRPSAETAREDAKNSIVKRNVSSSVVGYWGRRMASNAYQEDDY